MKQMRLHVVLSDLSCTTHFPSPVLWIGLTNNTAHCTVQLSFEP